MKILIATGIYPPDIGGPATYSRDLTGELLSRGNEVVVVTYGDSSTYKNGSGIVVVSRTLPRGIRHVVYFFKIFSSAHDADIIYAQDPVSAGLPAFFAAALLRKKFYLKIVGDYAWEQGVQRFGVTELLDDFLRTRYGFMLECLRTVQSFVARRAFRIIVPSEYLKNVVTQWGVQGNKIILIPNSVERVSMLSRDGARKKLRLQGTVMLSVGRLVPWKGFSCLISIMTSLSIDPPPQLVIAGSGPEKAALEGLIKALKLENRVVLTGPLAKEVLCSYMAAADIFLLNTGYEGFSHQLLEAMAAGMPVVTTREGGNAEIIHDGENGLVAGYNKKEEWVHAIADLIGNPSLRKKITERARADALRYSRERMVTSTLEIFTSP